MTIRGRSRFAIILASIVVLFLRTQAPAESPKTIVSDTPLSGAQVVAKLIARTAERTEALEHYQGRRSYSLDYVGFPSNMHAEMVVDMDYQAPASKQFTVVSESGSKWIVTHIFKRLLESEREAMEQANRQHTSLNNDNYEFTLLPEEPQASGCRYVLSVEPRVPDKFLFRGRIWVDGTDFAVCRIEAEPAKNPSFWIRKTDIHHSYSKVGDFWLPTDNKSVSSVRMGGLATLNIKYQDYKILQSHALGQPAPATVSRSAPAPKTTNQSSQR